MKTTELKGDNWHSDIIYIGGSPAAEQKIITQLGKDVHEEVINIAKRNNQAPIRPQHTKMLGGFTNAVFQISEDINDDFQIGFLKPGASYQAIVRFSNAGAYMAPDASSDLRGAAISVIPDTGERHDWLMTNAEQHHARNAVQALATSIAFCFPGKWNKIKGLLSLIGKFGISETLRIVKTVGAQSKIPVESIATETFFSRAPIRIGKVAVKYRLLPVSLKNSSAEPCNDLSRDLAARLHVSDLKYLLQVQRFDSNVNTPIEDSTVIWRTPFVTIAELILPKQELINDELFFAKHHFSPWNLNSTDFEPLGNMNRARRVVYASAAHTQQK